MSGYLPRATAISATLARGWLIVLLLVGVWQLLGPTLPPALDLSQISVSPSARHWLGTDPFGRDVRADVLAGVRSLLLISLPAAGAASLLGVLLGAAAGYWGNGRWRIPVGSLASVIIVLLGMLITSPQHMPFWVLGGLLMLVLSWLVPVRQKRVSVPVDQGVLLSAAMLGAVPRLLLLLVLVAAFPPSPAMLAVVLACICWPSTARLVRTQVRQLRDQPFMDAGKAAGLPVSALLWRHLVPNTWPALRATLPLNLGACIALQTTLAFIGIGLPADWADWGRTMAHARLEPQAWWLLAGPAVPLTLTLLALRLLLPARPAE